MLWDRRGSVTVIVSLASAVIFGLAAVSIDAGRAYVTHQRLVDLADAAALAGVQELPQAPLEAVTRAQACLDANGFDCSRANVTVVAPNRLRVELEHDLSFPFGAVLGRGHARLRAAVEAEAVNAGAIYGAQPFGVETAPFVYGEPYVIKLQAGGGTQPQQGNFHALALGGPGASNFRNNVKFGYQELVRSGQVLATEPGNMAGPTEEGLSYRLAQAPGDTFADHRAGSPRVLFVPIVDSFDVDGRKHVQVLGFAAFFLENVDGSNVYGRFIHYVLEAADTAGAQDFGLRTCRLLRTG